MEDYQETYTAILNSSKLNDREKEKVYKNQAYALQKIMDYAYLYGSENTCKLAAAWQQYTYLESQRSNNLMIPVCYANIFIAQICLDVTGNCNSPSYYYSIKLKDYADKKDEIEVVHNGIVERLKLDDRLRFNQ